MWERRQDAGITRRQGRRPERAPLHGFPAPANGPVGLGLGVCGECQGGTRPGHAGVWNRLDPMEKEFIRDIVEGYKNLEMGE